MISPGLAGVACKFTVNMKVRHILHEKNTTISPGLAGANKITVKMKVRRIFTRENTMISPGVGGSCK